MLHNNLTYDCLLSVYMFRSQASRGTVKLWFFCSSSPDVYYPQQSSQPSSIQHCLVLWQGKECRNVDTSQAAGKRILSTWRIPALSTPHLCPSICSVHSSICHCSGSAWVAALGLCTVGQPGCGCREGKCREGHSLAICT